MAKLLVFFMFCFGIGTVLSGMTEAEAGLAATVLTVDVDAEAATITVASTSGFLTSDYIWVGNERIAYGSKDSTHFNSLTRGTGGTDADAHSAGTKVYDKNSNVFDELLNFNVAASTSTFGTFKAAFQTSKALITAVPRIISWDYSYLGGELAYVKYMVLYPLSAGLVISFIALMLSAAQGIFRP